jgi:hypothetical protein
LEWPDSSVVYSVRITDKYGCSFYDVSEVLVTPLNSEEISKNQVKVFPNPVDHVLSIQLPVVYKEIEVLLYIMILMI